VTTTLHSRRGTGRLNRPRCRREAHDTLEPHPARGALGTTPTEDLDERVPKLSTHRTVKNEIDRVIQERHDVQQITERPVNVRVELGDEDTAEGEDALWELGEQEEPNDGEQHGSGAVRLAGPVRLVLAALRLELHATDVGVVHGDQEQDGEDGEQEAGQEFDEECLDPVVDLDEGGVGRVLHCVERE